MQQQLLLQTPTTKALQVINFNSCELRASVDSSFSSNGPLKVLYLPSYDKFLLNLNDWNYMLSKHLPAVNSTKKNENLCVYTLPGPKGSFALKLNVSPNSAVVHNLNTILSCYSNLHQKEDIYSDFHNTSMDVKYMEDHPIFAESQEHELRDNNKGQKLSVRDLMDDNEAANSKEEALTSSLHNLNIAEIKDINSIKRTPETEAEVFHLPTSEVLRMIEFTNEISAKLDDLSDSNLGLTYDHRATADTLTFTLEKLIGDEHSAILSSPGESKSRDRSLFLGLSGFGGDKNEEEMQNEIMIERGIQEEARKLQEEAMKYELDNIMRERKAREELMTEAMFEDYDTLVMSEVERKIVEKINKISEELEVYEEELIVERFEELEREKELKGEIERLKGKLMEKEMVLREEKEALKGKIRVLEDLMVSSDRAVVALEDRCEVLRLKMERRGEELKERLKELKEMVEENKADMSVENKKGKVEEGRRKQNIEKLKKLVKREEEGYNKIKKMLEKEVEGVNREKGKLEDEIKRFEEQFEESQEALKKKEMELEVERSNLKMAEEKLRVLIVQEEMEMRRLYETQVMSEMEREELKRREKIIEKDVEDLAMEQYEFGLREKEFMVILKEREEKYQADCECLLATKEEILKEMNEINEEMENGKMQFEEELMRDWLKAEEGELDLEAKRVENEMRKAKMELMAQKENVVCERMGEELERKKAVNEEKLCMVMYRKQKMAREAEEDMERREWLLREIKLQQEVVINMGKQICMGHEVVQKEIERAEMELAKPMEFQLELERYFMKVQQTECMEDCP